MELEGEVSIYLDEVLSASMELDTERLAHELATDYDFVDDTVLHAHVEEYCDSYVDDLVTERVHQETQELRDQVAKLEPNNNYVRINDLRTIMREEIVETLSNAISVIDVSINSNRTSTHKVKMSEWAREEKGMIDGRESVR